ncbi:MAG: fasciclin domain-containing protein [Pseudomonadota bacterium]
MLKKLALAATLTASLGFLATPNAKAASIVDTAAQAGQFETLLAAAKAAGLAGALSSGGPFTVFAPTDDAFAALPAGTVETLLKPENKDQLAAILSYHVLPRELTSNMLPGRRIHVRTIKSGGDRLLAVAKTHGGVTVDGANVVAADIQADNGVIHVIDKVMLPDS